MSIEEDSEGFLISTRAQHATLFEQALEFWRVLVGALGRKKRATVSMPGEVFRDLVAHGLDSFLEGGHFGAVYFDAESGVEEWHRSEDVPSVPPKDFTLILYPTDGLRLHVEILLREHWKAVMPRGTSQPAFPHGILQPPDELDEFVAMIKRRIRGAFGPKRASKGNRASAKPPRYILLVERDGFRIKWLDAPARKGGPVFKSVFVPLKKFRGANLRLLKLIIGKCPKVTFHSSFDTSAELQPVIVDYRELWDALMRPHSGGRRIYNDSLLELDGFSVSFDRRQKNAIRQGVHRFNEIWRKLTKHGGTWLAPLNPGFAVANWRSTRLHGAESNREAGWRLQVLIFWAPDVESDSSGLLY
jgi:hypothetical protein